MDTLTSISLKDERSLARVDRLLRQEGISRDGNLDYICGLFNEEDELVATGSCFRNTIRCLAVSHDRKGEGLLNRVMTHLMEVQAGRGNSHVFLYTKPSSARFFGDLGFYEIARVEGKLVFMENRRNGFARFCESLQPGPAGRTAAIVMNANPFTLGHRFLVERAAQENDTVHLFVLDEEAGPIPAGVRRKLVKEGTADLSNVYLHNSGPYIISSATFPSYFLKDGDEVTVAQGELDARVFLKIAGALGITRRYVGEEKASHTTALYNQALEQVLPAGGVECLVVPRLAVEGQAVSASTVRQAIHDGRMDLVKELVPRSTLAYFASPESLPVREAIRREENLIHH